MIGSRCWLGLVLFALACTPSRGEHDPPTPEPERAHEPPAPGHDGAGPPKAPEPKAPEPADDSRWTCETDQDCVQTCALGAVSRAWLETSPNADDCDDGCGWHHDGVRCQTGECVTLNPDGSINESCTHRTKSMYD